jgi:hypothetical protein
LAADNKRSPMFVGSLVAAISATVALAFLLVVQVTAPPGPPPGSQQQGPGGRPPPLLNPQNLVSIIVIVAALFTIAWVATIAAAARDLILRDTQKIMSEYGELRETDGYVNGYRQGGRPEAEVRQLHPVPPID